MFLSLYALRVLDSGVIFSTGERVSLLVLAAGTERSCSRAREGCFMEIDRSSSTPEMPPLTHVLRFVASVEPKLDTSCSSKREN
jgi:hypothetical protein